MIHVLWTPHVTISFICILPVFHLNCKTPHVLKVLKLNLFPFFDEPLENIKFSSTDILSVQHEYDLFLLNQEIDTPSDNLNHQDTYVCEKHGQDDFLIHATELCHNFALPQYMAQYNVKT